MWGPPDRILRELETRREVIGEFELQHLVPLRRHPVRRGRDVDAAVRQGGAAGAAVVGDDGCAGAGRAGGGVNSPSPPLGERAGVRGLPPVWGFAPLTQPSPPKWGRGFLVEQRPSRSARETRRSVSVRPKNGVPR